MTPLEATVVLLAGVAAGTINTIVGSGTLITFPTLLAFGVPPVTANASNTVGLVPGSLSGAYGYRRELVGQRSRVLRLLSASALGGLAGAALLLVLPESAFEAIVPALIALGIVLVVTGPRVSRWVARRHAGEDGLPHHGAWWVWPAILLAGVYGGYFGAAQGVLLIAILGIGIQENLQSLNGIKNLLGAAVNGVSGLVFVLIADIDWQIVLLIAAGSVVGGQIGARVGRRLPDRWLRGAIVVVGLTALYFFLR